MAAEEENEKLPGVLQFNFRSSLTDREMEVEKIYIINGMLRRCFYRDSFTSR